MSIKIEITGELNDEVIIKQLNSFGWAQVIENSKTFFVLYRRVKVNGEYTDVEAYQLEYSSYPDCAIFQTGIVPKGVNLRTGNTVYRILSGKIVSDLIRNDDLKIKKYSISFQ